MPPRVVAVDIDSHGDNTDYQSSMRVQPDYSLPQQILPNSQQPQYPLLYNPNNTLLPIANPVYNNNNNNMNGPIHPFQLTQQNGLESPTQLSNLSKFFVGCLLALWLLALINNPYIGTHSLRSYICIVYACMCMCARVCMHAELVCVCVCELGDVCFTKMRSYILCMHMCE